MVGWYLDVLVGYLISLFRIVARGRRARRCNGWVETTATIVGISCRTAFFLPRPIAEIVYTYHFDGGFYGGVDEKPFYTESSAKKYVDQVAKGDNLVVRVNPGEPEISVVLDQDQVSPNEMTTGSRASH
jgi:hypothetical protein